jgi:hypothetical protein
MSAVSRRTPVLDALGPMQGFIEAVIKVGETLCDVGFLYFNSPTCSVLILI